MRIAQNLHFHVPRAPDQFFEVHLILAECGLGFALRRRHVLEEFACILDDAHAAAAAAPTRFEHQRVADALRQRAHLSLVVGQRWSCRHDGHSRGSRQISRFDFVAEPAHGVRQRPHENEAGGGAGLRKLGTFGEEAVTRVNGIGPRLDRNADDVGDIEIRLDRSLAGAHQVAFVGFGPMQRAPVFLRVNGNGADAKLGRGAHDANGNFTAIGD